MYTSVKYLKINYEIQLKSNREVLSGGVKTVVCEIIK